MKEHERTFIIETIKFHTEIVKVLALFILAVSTGVMSLLLGQTNDLKTYLVALFGVVLILFFLLLLIICVP